MNTALIVLIWLFGSILTVKALQKKGQQGSLRELIPPQSPVTVKHETRPCTFFITTYKKGQPQKSPFAGDGIFHGWGSKVVGSNDIFYMETMGVIEDVCSGRVNLVFPDDITFTDKDNNAN